MKRIISIGLIALFIFQVAGFYVYFCFRIIEIRRQMRHELATLPCEKLSVIKVNTTDFNENWLEEMEMEWKGGMYDIAQIEQQGSLVLIYCQHDQMEDNLIAFLENLMEQTDETGDSSNLLDLIDADFVGAFYHLKSHSLGGNPGFIPYQKNSYQFFRLLDSPPPWS